MWNTTDYKGNPVTWYSQDEMNWVMNKLDDANKCLQDCELHWERERKILKESLNKAHDANKSLGYTYLRYKQALEKIKESITLDDINCKISKETQNVCDDVLTIINEVTKKVRKNEQI